jgi:hypothetical protein
MKIQNKYLFLLLPILVCLVLLGCNKDSRNQSSNDTVAFDVNSKDLLEPNLEKLLINSTSLELGNDVTNLNILDINVKEKSNFVTYNFTQENTAYLAIMYAEEREKNKYELGFIERTQVSKNDPISIYNIVSETLSDKIKKKIRITIGCVNDNKVDTIYIGYPSGQVNGVKLGKEQTTFTHVLVGSDEYPLFIRAVSNDNDVLFEKNTKNQQST